jgi:hypothetical protein
MQQDAGHNEERRMRNLKTYSDTKSKEEKDYESRKGDDLTFLKYANLSFVTFVSFSCFYVSDC